MEVECVPVEDESRLAELRFDAAVKVIKSLPPNGEWPRRLLPGPARSGLDLGRFKVIHLTCSVPALWLPVSRLRLKETLINY